MASSSSPGSDGYFVKSSASSSSRRRQCRRVQVARLVAGQNASACAWWYGHRSGSACRGHAPPADGLLVRLDDGAGAFGQAIDRRRLPHRLGGRGRTVGERRRGRDAVGDVDGELAGIALAGRAEPAAAAVLDPQAVAGLHDQVRELARVAGRVLDARPGRRLRRGAAGSGSARRPRRRGARAGAARGGRRTRSGSCA